MDSKNTRFEIDKGIATVTLSLPKHTNAVTPVMSREEVSSGLLNHMVGREEVLPMA